MALPRARVPLLALAVALIAAPAAHAAPPALTPSTVGEPPNGGGVFRFPQAVAFSPGGARVFVGDQYGSAVQAFGADGTFQFAFGSRQVRREPGRLGVVGGVATDRTGHVYVLDSEDDRVEVFGADDGHFISAFGDSSTFDLASGTPNVEGGISASGIAVVQSAPGAAPVVYVADQGNDQVDRFVLDPSSLAVTSTTTRSDLGLDHPQGIALDPAATRVYVADDDNHRVVVLDPTSLALVAQVGTFGTAPGQFQNPYDVAVDTHNQLYVADNLNNRVDVFDATTLASTGTFGSAGHTVGRFSIVRAVGALADDPRGGVDVADTANNRIQALDPTGALQAAWGIAGRGPGYLTRPRGVAFDPSGGITVADAFDHRVERFDADGTFGGQFGLVSQSTGFAAPGSAAGQFNTPSGVAYDAAGNLWVADTANSRVVELDPASGSVLYTSPAGTFSGPRALAATSAGVYVADTGNGRVALIAPDRTVTPVRGGLAAPVALASDGAAAVYVATDTQVLDAVSGASVAAPGGGAWDHPDGLAFDPASSTLYVAERRPGTAGGARVVRGVRSGPTFSWDTIAREGAAEGEVIDPAGLAVSADGGTLLVADSGNDRIERFDAPGHAPPSTQPLTVSLSDITRGLVTSAPAGIACATDCIQHYGSGRQVTLTAAPSAGSVFAGWGGDCAPAGTAPTCAVTMDAARSASAAFAPAPPPPPPAAASAPSASPPAAPPAAVRIAALRLSSHHLLLARRADHRRHRHSRHATTARVTVAITIPARLTVTLQVGRPGRRHGSTCVAIHRRRTRANCTRFVTLPGHRTLTREGGTGVFRLSTVWNGRTLKAGSYRIAITALDARGNRVGPVTGAFTVSA